MLHNITRHLPHYLSLLGIIIVAGLGINYFEFDKYFQSAITISAGVAYVFWGIIHHHILEESHIRLHFEYLASAMLGSIVLLAIIWA